MSQFSSAPTLPTPTPLRKFGFLYRLTYESVYGRDGARLYRLKREVERRAVARLVFGKATRAAWRRPFFGEV